MCSSDKQNMDIKIDNPVFQSLMWGYKFVEDKLTELTKKPELENNAPELEHERTEFIRELEKKIKESKELVKKAKGWERLDTTFIGKVREGICLNAIGCLFHNNLTGNVRNVVDLSVTELTTASLPTFWSTLENFENLTSLGVAVTEQSVITLPDGEDKLQNLKGNLKKLRMEGHAELEKLGEFGELSDLTLANMDIEKIPDLPKLLCLRLYGICQEETCKIELKKFSKPKKLVIGDMGKVETVKISSAVLETIVTLKFSNLPNLKKVAYTDKPDSFPWGNKTIFLRDSGDGDIGVENSPGLQIYKYDREMQRYVLRTS